MFYLILNPFIDKSTDVWMDAGKVVQICLVCIIFLANLFLIALKIHRKGCGKVFRKARCTVQLSLGVAGIVCALFYHVVSTVVIFDVTSHGLNCETLYVSRCYFFTFLPLLYGTGLLVLATDMVFRFKAVLYKTLSQSRAYPILCAILPWVMSLAVSCPLTMTDIEWDKECAVSQDLTHFQASIICCVLVPVGLTSLAVFGVAILVHPRQSYTFHGVGVHSAPPGQSLPSDQHTSTPGTDGGDVGVDSADRLGEGREEKEMKDFSGTSSPIQNGHMTGRLQRFTSSSPLSIHVSTADHIQEYPSSTHTQADRFRSEKKKLLASMVLFSLLVLPYGCFFLYVTSEHTTIVPTAYIYMVELELFIANFMCVGIFNLFPLIIPLVWLCTKY